MIKPPPLFLGPVSAVYHLHVKRMKEIRHMLGLLQERSAQQCILRNLVQLYLSWIRFPMVEAQ